MKARSKRRSKARGRHRFMRGARLKKNGDRGLLGVVKEVLDEKKIKKRGSRLEAGRNSMS